jgi:hypothetical protein
MVGALVGDQEKQGEYLAKTSRYLISNGTGATNPHWAVDLNIMVVIYKRNSRPACKV